MELLIIIAVSAAFTVSSISFFAIRNASTRPHNQDLKTLEQLDRKILRNQETLSKCVNSRHFIINSHKVKHI